MPPRILIVDDSELLRKLILRHMSRFDAELVECPGGEAALAEVARQAPDLILLDIEMPDLSGMDVIVRLKADPTLYSVPVIFLTGHADRSTKLKAFDLGATDYIVKPFDAGELQARVRSALRTKALLDMLATQASLDGLTGLHNRRFFDERLAVELDRCRRYGRHMGLLLMDVDAFKKINDGYGHPKGDEVLIATARVLRQQVRQSDHPCRYGGDEFSVILPESDAKAVRTFGQRLFEALAANETLQTLLKEPVTFSLGAASTDGQVEQDASGLLMRADQMLYAVKQAGRNAFQLAA